MRVSIRQRKSERRRKQEREGKMDVGPRRGSTQRPRDWGGVVSESMEMTGLA